MTPKPIYSIGQNLKTDCFLINKIRSDTVVWLGVPLRIPEYPFSLDVWFPDVNCLRRISSDQYIHIFFKGGVGNHSPISLQRSTLNIPCPATQTTLRAPDV
jgi:hypothetical protein